MANDIIVSEMTSASQINTNDLMIMTQPDLQAETGYSTKKGTVLQVANKMLKGTEYLTDLPDFTNKTVLGGLEELKGDLTALLPVNTASGAIANFDTDLSLPLVDCKASIVASQASGTPTPSTPLPITGYTGMNLTVANENMTPQHIYHVSWQTEAGTVYGGNLDLTTGVLTVTWLGKTYTGDANENWVMHGSGSALAFAMRSSVYLNIDINELPKADYLQGISRNTTWGNFDNWVSVTSGMQIVTGIQSITSVTDWTDYLALNPLTVIWKAETPVTYQLTPVQVNALLGVNNVFNDTNGDTEVQYKDSIQHYIDTRV